jgi:hypothetical protein
VPFTIQLNAPARARPESDNVVLATEITRAFSSVTDFPLDHDLIAREYARVPRQDVLNHWAQIELHGDDSLGRPIITLWLSAAFVELGTTPSESCEEQLRRVEPVLALFRGKGFTGPNFEELVAEYEEQRRRVEAVARIVGGRMPNA